MSSALYICITEDISVVPSMVKNGKSILFFTGAFLLLMTCKHRAVGPMGSADAVASDTTGLAVAKGKTIAAASANPLPGKTAPAAAAAPVAPPTATAAPVVSKRKLTASVLTPALPDTMPYITFDPAMLQALYEQANYLERNDVRSASGITRAEMLETVNRLEGVQLLHPSVLQERFDFYQINTGHKKEKVRITGYYTPLVKASRTRTAEFQHPLYKRPDSGIPSPAAIEAGALNGRNLELAWLASKKEVKNAQMQGSCLVEFTDGTREHFGFGGSVKGSGGTHVFFTKVDNRVLGAGFFPLTAGYSVAVDPRFIPIGSVLFAELPQMDAAGHLRGYTYRILFAQDRGGAIKTTNRLDLYSGVGQHGLQEARKINGFGRLWLMLPRQDVQPPGTLR
jgi:membrane-bound lytic murein transglycosylase A